jgi:hypothetical protein
VRPRGSYSAATGRKFGLTVGAAFVVLATVARWRSHPTSFVVLGVLGLSLLAGSLVVPTLLGPVENAWMGLARAVSKVTTPIFMGVVYFVVLTPIGLLRRTFAGSALVHRAGPHGFWRDRSQSPRSDLNRQF